MTNNPAGFPRRAFLTALVGIFSSAAISVDLYQGPMVAERSMDPNVIYIHDDSGSMDWLHMPDEAPSGGNNQKSAFLNKQYYNPDITYQPPLTYDGGKLVSWGNMDERCAWPKVMNDGFTGSPGVCGNAVTLGASDAVYYDYVPGYNSRIDNRFSYTWEPIVMIDGKMTVNGHELATDWTSADWANAPENVPFNYERFAFRQIGIGDKVMVSGSTTNGAVVNATEALIDNRACPVLFKDVPESRAYYANFPGAPGAPGNPHATCRFSYRTGEVDFESNYQDYVSNRPYAGQAVTGNYHGRVWCYRSSYASSFTASNIDRTCVMGRHIIGDTTGNALWTNNSGATDSVLTDFVSDFSHTANALKTTKDQSLEHRVSKFVADGGELITEPTPRRRTAKEEIRNFANWYSYYRKRSMAAKSGASLAFANLVNRNDTTKPGAMMRGKVIRLGYDTINRMNSDGPGQRSGGVTTTGRGVVPFIDNDPNYPGKKFVKDFYDWVNALPASGGTPLSGALTKVGNYLANSHQKPWLEYPPDTYNGTGSGQVFGCRRSFAILMTDGYSGDWGSQGDVDGSNGPEIWKTDIHNTSLTGNPKNKYQYTPQTPFFGQYAGYRVSNSLADVAMYYWNRDLQPDIPNMVAPTKKDPAFWQHMQTFTIGLGVIGRLSDTEVNQFLATGTNKKILWTFPTGLDTNYERVDDLMHAGLNGHAGTAAAEDAGEFAGKLATLLSEIAGQDGSNTAPAVPRNLDESSMYFEASYSPSEWSGELLGRETCLKDDGAGVCGNRHAAATGTVWSASERLAKQVESAGHAARKIFTRNDGGSIVAFDTSLSASTKAAIDVDLDHSAGTPIPENCVMARPHLGDPPAGDACVLHRGRPEQKPYNVDLLIEYLRGDQTYEDTTTSMTVNYNGFRRRSYTDTNGVKQVKLLGDIVNSSPTLITDKTAESNWDQSSRLGASTNPAVPTSGAAANYLLRKASHRNADGTVNTANREQTVLVGAGDGMLHGFDAQTGEEQFAYIPSALHGILKKLADPQYGQIDTLKHSFYVDGVTIDADILLEDNWTTVAVGSTGRSNSGKGSYFALDVEKASTFDTGDVLWEFTHSDLGAPGNGRAEIALLPDNKWYALFGNGYNSANQKAGLFLVELASGAAYDFIDTGAGGSGAPNGLGTPSFITGADGAALLAYAGDLLGNVWKFDLEKRTATKLLEATGPDGAPQPITAAPRIVFTKDDKVQVIVGTGKFLEQSDVDDVHVQTIYSVRDNCGITSGCTPPVATRSALTQLPYDPMPMKTDTYTDGNGEVGTLTGWKIGSVKLDYAVTQGFFLDMNAPGMKGLRVIDKGTEKLRNNIQVPFLEPSNDPCASAVEGGYVELDPVGGAPKKSELFKTLSGINFYKFPTSNGAGLSTTVSGGNPGVFGRSDGVIGGLKDNDPASKKCVWIDGRCVSLIGGGKMGRQSWRQLR
jgi:type IV pilus assembly protein PilY1